MARKPARLERAGALTPRDRMWDAIRGLWSSNGYFSAVEVAWLANLKSEHQAHVDSVLSYLIGLSRATPPYVELVERGANGRRRSELWQYRLLRDVGVEAPRVTEQGKPVTEGIGTERMWTAMKSLREFDHAELAAACTDAQHQVSEETAKTYCTFLERAGYLRLEVPAKGGKSAPSKARFSFVRARNSGPRAPLICRDKTVIDGNSGQLVWEPSKGEKGCQSKT